MMACPVCGNSSTKDIATFRSQNPVFSGCLRATCTSCDMVYATPMPPESALSEYNARYFSAAHAGKPSSLAALAFFSGIARLRLAFVKRFLDGHHIAVNHVLEFGPGLGFFAKSWKELHPLSAYSVVETDSSCHKSLQALGAQIVEASNIGPSDLVVMSHVLEHVSDPVAFLHSATRRLRRGGAVFIEVPCQDWKHKALDEPHVLFFEKKSIQLLLARLGFDDIQASYYGQPIRVLCSRSWLHNKLMAIRGKLIGLGVISPFSTMAAGLEPLIYPIERAVVKPFLAHRESDEPAWWLRVVARKL
jgi:hypothetical protein